MCSYSRIPGTGLFLLPMGYRKPFLRMVILTRHVPDKRIVIQGRSGSFAMNKNECPSTNAQNISGGKMPVEDGSDPPCTTVRCRRFLASRKAYIFVRTNT